MESIKELTPKELDKIVCDWSMAKGVALTEDQQNSLVDRLCILVLGHPPVVSGSIQ